MLWFIAILATANLCVGYALGASFGWSLLGLEGVSAPRLSLPGLSLLKRKKAGAEAADSETADPEPLAQPPAEEAAESVSAEPPAAADPADPPAPAEPSDPPANDSKPSAAEVMEGLAAFQAQLAGLSQELQETEEEKAFDDCAERMQQANHEYLGHAQDAIEKLDGDEAAAPVCDAVKQGAEEVQRVSDEFDAALDNEEKDEKARELLRGLSDKMATTAKSVEKRVRRAAPELDGAEAERDPPDLPPLDIDPKTSLATLDSLKARIETLLDDGEGRPPLIVAAVQADCTDENDFPAESLPALLPKLGELVGEAIGDAGPAALRNGDQLLMVLPGDSVDDASRRVEQIRQVVEAATFADHGTDRSVTVSCGIAQSSAEATLDGLQELLDEALSEAHRYGGNRACHHDGKFPAPVMPEDVEAEPRTITL